MNMKEMLTCYIDHRREVIYRRTTFRLRKAEARAHILEGYKIALDNMDDFVKIIRASKIAEAKKSLRQSIHSQRYRLLPFSNYASTNSPAWSGKIEEEYLALMAVIEELRSILDSEQKLLMVIKEELSEMKDKYGNPRRSKILPLMVTYQWKTSYQRRMHDHDHAQGLHEAHFSRRIPFSETWWKGCNRLRSI